MKLIYAVLLFVVVTDFVSAESEKDTGSSAAKSFYCIDAQAKAVKVGLAGFSEIANLCKGQVKSDQSACLEKAKSSYCKSINTGVKLYFKLSEVPNTTSCTQFANKFLENRGLGRLDKLGASVNTSAPITKSATGQPVFQLNYSGATNTAVYATSKIDPQTNLELWTMVVSGNTKIPLFEQNKDKGTVPDGFEPGDYKRYYRFAVVNDICVLTSIETKFLPVPPKGEEDYPKYRMEEKTLDQKECDYSAQAFRGERYKRQFGRSPQRDLLNNWVCSESVTAFNQPEAATAGHKARNVRGTKDALSPR